MDSRLTHGFRLLLSRQPKPQELAILRSGCERASKGFKADPESVKTFLAVGDAKADATLDPTELAAFSSVASTLFNLDEAVTKP